jgi:hypothetical protein
VTGATLSRHKSTKNSAFYRFRHNTRSTTVVTRRGSATIESNGSYDKSSLATLPGPYLRIGVLSILVDLLSLQNHSRVCGVERIPQAQQNL